MRFRLTAQHAIGDMLLPEDTEIEPAEVELVKNKVGKIVARKIVKMGRIWLKSPVTIEPPSTGRRTYQAQGQVNQAMEVETDWTLPPSAFMEGLDEEAIAAVEKRMETYMEVENAFPVIPLIAPGTLVSQGATPPTLTQGQRK